MTAQFESPKGETKIDELRRAITAAQETYYSVTPGPFKLTGISWDDDSIKAPAKWDEEWAMELLRSGNWVEISWHAGGTYVPLMTKVEWDALDEIKPRYVWEGTNSPVEFPPGWQVDTQGRRIR